MNLTYWKYYREKNHHFGGIKGSTAEIALDKLMRYIISGEWVLDVEFLERVFWIKKKYIESY